jgi:hypothetical protein
MIPAPRTKRPVGETDRNIRDADPLSPLKWTA